MNRIVDVAFHLRSTRGKERCETSSGDGLILIPSRRVTGAGIHHDALQPLILGECSPHRLRDLVVTLLSELAGFTVDLARRTDRQLKAHCIVQVLADEHCASICSNSTSL